MKAKCEWCSEFKDCTMIADKPTGWTCICCECLAERKAAGIEDEELIDDAFTKVGGDMRKAMRRMDKAMGLDIAGSENQQSHQARPAPQAHTDPLRASGKDSQATKMPLQEEKNSPGVEDQA